MERGRRERERHVHYNSSLDSESERWRDRDRGLARNTRHRISHTIYLLNGCGNDSTLYIGSSLERGQPTTDLL